MFTAVLMVALMGQPEKTPRVMFMPAGPPPPAYPYNPDYGRRTEREMTLEQMLTAFERGPNAVRIYHNRGGRRR